MIYEKKQKMCLQLSRVSDTASGQSLALSAPLSSASHRKVPSLAHFWIKADEKKMLRLSCVTIVTAAILTSMLKKKSALLYAPCQGQNI